LAFARIAGIAFCTFSHADEVLEMKRREFIAGLGGLGRSQPTRSSRRCR
jgi:hypothetical protein